MDGEHRFDVLVPLPLGVEEGIVYRHQRALPVVRVDDIRPEIDAGKHLQHGAGKEREPLRVVVVAIQPRTLEIILIIQQIIDHAVMPGLKHPAVLPPPGHRHRQAGDKGHLLPQLLKQQSEVLLVRRAVDGPRRAAGYRVLPVQVHPVQALLHHKVHTAGSEALPPGRRGDRVGEVLGVRPPAHGDQQLEMLHVELIKMGALCEDAVSSAIEALEKNDIVSADSALDTDAEIDQKERDIERMCMKLLLQQQPVARDLRQISAALKMITDMERIGDQASDIAEIIITEDKSEAQDIPMIIKMSEAASKMVRDSVNAYVEKDLDLARKVMENDDVVDELFEEVKTTLINFIAENKGLQGVEAIDLIMVAKYLERIADHATNIAEWVEFSITGIHKSSVV